LPTDTADHVLIEHHVDPARGHHRSRIRCDPAPARDDHDTPA
jgi:hypothetical protein